jgi:hypothetical protein
MIPLFIKIGFRGKTGKNRNIWIPLPLFYIPLIILIVMFSPLLIVAGVIVTIWKGINIFKAVYLSLKVLAATCGILIDVNSEREKFHLTIQ